MTDHEKTAFKDAYMNCVSACSREDLDDFVDEYFKQDNDDNLYDKYPWIYGSIVDAITMWNMAIGYASKECA